MATVSVPVRILCDKKQLVFKHELPASVMGPTGLVSPAAQSLFGNAMKPIMVQHKKAALEACEKVCSADACTRDASQVNMTLMSYLHLPNEPHVAIMAVPHCGHEHCDIELRQKAAEIMQNISSRPMPPGNPVPEPGGKETDYCRICGSFNGVLKCGRCMAVGYCSKEHQKADWRRHKAGCTAV